MGQIIVVGKPKLDIVPAHFVDMFTDAVLEAYITFSETPHTKGLSYIPNAYQMVLEEEMLMFSDEMTSDMEFGTELIYHVFESEDDEYNFYDKSRENLFQLKDDIRTIFEFLRLSHMVHKEFKNMPIKEVW